MFCDFSFLLKRDFSALKVFVCSQQFANTKKSLPPLLQSHQTHGSHYGFGDWFKMRERRKCKYLMLNNISIERIAYCAVYINANRQQIKKRQSSLCCAKWIKHRREWRHASLVLSFMSSTTFFFLHNFSFIVSPSSIVFHHTSRFQFYFTVKVLFFRR